MTGRGLHPRYGARLAWTLLAVFAILLLGLPLVTAALGVALT